VAVVGLPHDKWGEQACACIVLKKGAKADEDELLEFLRTRLATYKLPERMELLDELPLSANGKVLKNQLREQLLEKA
jgi:acyl-CoA synthetase (AMP-forming)/AMP-acid ligase II